MQLILVFAATVLAIDATFFGSPSCGCQPPVPCAPPVVKICPPACPVNPCGRRKKRLAQSELGTSDTASVNDVVDTSVCNDAQLQAIMHENMHGTAKQAKMRVVSKAEQQLGGQFTVVCAAGAFSYLTTTSTYCLHTHNNINCYAFRTDR